MASGHNKSAITKYIAKPDGTVVQVTNPNAPDFADGIGAPPGGYVLAIGKLR